MCQLAIWSEHDHHMQSAHQAGTDSPDRHSNYPHHASGAAEIQTAHTTMGPTCAGVEQLPDRRVKRGQFCISMHLQTQYDA